MDKKVTVLTPNGRRQNVKITPNTTLLQVLEEACQKHGLDSDEFCLKHHNREVDLTQMFRFTGLPNNCLLEMAQLEKKRVASKVDICIQLEDGSRLQGQFSSTDSIWAVIDALSRDRQLNYPSPVAIYMRREIIGMESLSTTTLKSLGITEGRALIRFINKNPEDLKEQANVYTPAEVKPTSKEETPRPSGRKSDGGGGFAITKNLMQALKKNPKPKEKPIEDSGSAEQEKEKEAEVKIKEEKPKYDWGTGIGHSMTALQVEVSDGMDSNELDDEPDITIVGERNAIIFSLDSMQKHMEDLPDSFFDLTVHDLKLILRDLKKISAGDEDSPLLTEKLRQLEESKSMLNKIAQYKNCIIRIQFPDRHVLQGIFKPIDRMSNVNEFVRKFLSTPNMKFHLFTIPPKTIPPQDKTLLEMDFVPNALLHFGVGGDDSPSTTDIPIQNYLKPELMDQLTTAEGALYAATKFRVTARKSSTETNNNIDDPVAMYESQAPGPSTGAIPKRRRDEPSIS